MALESVLSYNTLTDKWTDENSHLNQARLSASAASFGSKIYIAGGLGSDWEALSSVELLDVAMVEAEVKW